MEHRWSKTFCVFFAALLLLTSFVISASAADEGQQISMDNGNITYYGRWDDLSDGVVQLNFQSGFEVIFTGTSAAVGIAQKGSASEYMYSIDGGAFTRVLDPAVGYNTLATGLSAGEHTLTFYSSSQGSRNRITGLRFDSGAVLKKVPKKKTIEFIGDSITAGWIGNGYINWLYKCYTWQTAKKLDLGFNVVARGGIGLITKGSDTLNMSDRYFRSLPYSQIAGNDEVYPMLDTSRYTPDYIVINLGTNDRSHSSTKFEAVYTEFLTNLRKAYPKTTIFALRPLGGRDITGGDGYFKKEIIAAVNARRKAGDKNTFFIDTTGWVEPSDFQDQLHFNYVGNEHLAERLADAIRDYIDHTPGTGSAASGTAATKPVGTRPVGTTAAGTKPVGTTAAAGTVQTTGRADGVSGTAPAEPSDGEKSSDVLPDETAPDTPADPVADPTSAADPAGTEPADGTPARAGWTSWAIMAGALVLGGGAALWFFVFRKKTNV